MAEGEHGLHALLVNPAVAEEDAFLILFVYDFLAVAPCSGVRAEPVRRIVVELSQPRIGQLARRVDAPGEHVGQRIACGRAEEPALHDGVDLADPRHRHGIARYVDVHEVGVGLGKSLDQAVLAVRQTVVQAVVALGVLMVALVEAAEHDYVVGLAGLLHGLGQQLVGRAQVVKALLGNYSVTGAGGVADVSAGVLHLDFTAQGAAQAVERQHLTLRLERRAASAYSHHLDGVLANHEHGARLRGVDGQHSALVLEQHYAVSGHLPRRGVVRLGVHRAESAAAVHRRAEEEAEHTAHLVVEFLGGIFALSEQLEVRTRHEVVVVCF